MKKLALTLILITSAVLCANAQLRFKQIKYFGETDTLTMYYPADNELIKTYEAERQIAEVNDTILGDKITVERLTSNIDITTDQAKIETGDNNNYKVVEETSISGQPAIKLVYTTPTDSTCFEKYIIKFDNTYRYDITFSVTSPSRYLSYYQGIYKMVKSIKVKK